MIKPVIISASAQRDLTEIVENVVDYTGHTASGVKLFNEIYEKFDLISQLPKCGKSREDGTREIFARSYRIVYQELDETVQILTVIHARRLYPKN